MLADSRVKSFNARGVHSGSVPNRAWVWWTVVIETPECPLQLGYSLQAPSGQLICFMSLALYLLLGAFLKHCLGLRCFFFSWRIIEMFEGFLLHPPIYEEHLNWSCWSSVWPPPGVLLKNCKCKWDDLKGACWTESQAAYVWWYSKRLVLPLSFGSMRQWEPSSCWSKVHGGFSW